MTSPMPLLLRLLLVCLIIPFSITNAFPISRLRHPTLFLHSGSCHSHSNLNAIQPESNSENQFLQENEESRPELFFRPDFSEYQNKVDSMRRIWGMINSFEGVEEDTFCNYDTSNIVDSRERSCIRDTEVNYQKKSEK